MIWPPRVEELPPGTVLGGVDKPMSIEVRCACGQMVELEYHDIQARWYRASADPGPRPGWEEYDAARPVAADETALDMSCPHCTRPMRVIIHASEWRMSIWAFYVMAVLISPDLPRP